MDDRAADPPEFEALRVAGRAKRIAVLIAGPLIWLIALVGASLILHRTDAIELGVLVAASSFLAASATLGLLHSRRDQEERANRDR